MRVLCVSENDYGNYSHNFSKALTSIGVDSVDLCLSPHPFLYSSQSKLVSRSEMSSHMADADVVIVHHSHPGLFNAAMTYCKGKVIVTHTGTRYREGHKELDILFKDTLSFTDHTEFLQINPNLHYIVSPVEFDCAPLATSGRLRFAHYPSNAEVKGTAEIMRMIAPYIHKMDWRVGTTTVDHYTQLQRIANCDVYIELFKPELNGKPYGCFGVTALEAAAMGRIVVTNNLHNKVYTDAYGMLPFTIANTEKVFTNTINGLLNLDLQMIRDTQKQTWEIMRENHSYKATGERILKVIES